MKKIFTITFILTILISACGSSISTTAPSASESALTVTQIPATSTATEIPPTLPTITPTPTLSLPVSQLTPVPSSSTKITAENIKDLQEIARYYGEINYFAKVTKDNKFLFMLDPDGLTKYDYSSMEKLVSIPLLNKVSDLQISNDGGLLLVDNNWLLDLKNDKEPNLFVLSEQINLLNFRTTFSLSPDGSMIAVAQSNCPNTCEYVFRIVRTGDFKDLYTSSGLTHRILSTFSSDGKYFAAADLLTVETPGGGTEPAGGTVGVWTTNDFTKVASFRVNFPFDVTDIAFSEDDAQIAIAQRNSIDIYNVQNSGPIVAITDLCDSYQRRVMFVPGITDKLLENSDCSSGEWTISGSTVRSSNDDVPDLSRIAFDENGTFKVIPYPQPTNQNIRANHHQDYFTFLNDDILSFNYSRNKSCDFLLNSGSFECQSQSIKFNKGQYLGNDIIVATDGKYYSYVVGKSKVDIYSFDNPSQVYYSIPFQYFYFSLNALDPINNIIIYTFGVGGNSNRVIIQDMTNDYILEKWEGATSVASIAVSENSQYASFCRTIGNYQNPQEPYKDRLVIFDLIEKRTVYNIEFNCAASIDMSNDGSKLAIEHHYVRSPNDGFFYSRTMILNTTPPYEKKLIEFDSFIYPYAVAFSPDGSVLATGCGGIDICFFDSSGDNEIYRLKAHSGITNLAFSPDGSLLATSSNWGLISLWAVPPFTSDSRQPQSSTLSSYTPNFTWDFNEDGNFEGWGEQDWQSAGLKNLKVESGYLSASSTGPDTELYSNEGFGIDSSKFPQIKIRMRVSAGNSAVIYFTHGAGDWAEDQGKYFDIIADNEFHTYTINMSEVANWKGIIDQLRLDLRNADGAAIDIDYIHLLPLLPTSFSWKFDEAGNLEGWGEQDWQSAGLINLVVKDGYFSATATQNDIQLYSNEGFDIDASKFSKIEIRMRISSGNTAVVYFNNVSGGWAEDKGKYFAVFPDSEFHSYIINMNEVVAWQGNINQLRLDLRDASGATIEIDYIHLLP